MSKLYSKAINEKLDEVLKNMGSAANINISLAFIRNVETAEYRYYYARKNNNLFEKLRLLCTRVDLSAISGKTEKFENVEQCTQEHQNTKGRFKLIFKKGHYFRRNTKINPKDCTRDWSLALICRNSRLDIK